MMDPIAALLALATTAALDAGSQPANTASTTATVSRCVEACPTPSATRLIRTQTVLLALNEMLSSEGLTQVASVLPIIRPIELDGDSNTDEALVDVISPELCNPAGQCMTLIVRALPCGRLIAIGHGESLQPLASRTNRWMDLAETTPVLLVLPVALRALHFGGARYGS
jgi:hypothetical protein